MLDIKNPSKGILIPRTSTTTRTAIVNPAKGLMLYDTVTSSFWFYNGSGWNENTTSNRVWGLKGNGGTNSNTDFIGTTDLAPLTFRMNNLKSGIIDSASSNTSFGFKTLFSNTTGTLNTAFGVKALMRSSSGLNNTAIGSFSLHQNNGSNNTSVGALSLFADSNGSDNTATGTYTLFYNNGGIANTAIGYAALTNNTFGSNNTAIGWSALVFNQTASSNTAVGYSTLYNNNNGQYNTAMGKDAMGLNSSGSLNTAIGLAALAYNVSGDGNISIGWNSGVDITRPALNNTINIGNNGWSNGAHSQVLIGNQSTGWIGGWVPWTNASDERGKKNISDDVKGLDFIMRLRPVTYNVDVKAMIALSGNKDTEEFPGKYDVEQVRQTGFLAQEVERAATETNFEFSGVSKMRSGKEMYGLSYATFVVPIIKAMQEQQVIIDKQQKQIDELRLMILELKNASKQ